MTAAWVDKGVSPDGFAWREQEGGVEAIIGDPNFKHIWWLEEAVIASSKIARANLSGGTATCFLIGEDVLMTNNHVFENADDAATAKIEFNYRKLSNGEDAEIDVWECDPDDMFKTNPDLDYSIVRMKKKDGKKAGEVRGFFNLRHGELPKLGDRANLIQHPRGRRQEISFRDNQIKAIEDNFIQYLTDTDYGTSGSPVLDDNFNCIALHNQRVPDPDDPTKWYRNQGYRIDAILEDAGDLIP